MRFFHVARIKHTSNQVHKKESQILHEKYSYYSLMNNYSENYTHEYKKAFQYDACRPLTNCTCFGGYDQVSVAEGWVFQVPWPGYPPPDILTPLNIPTRWDIYPPPLAPRYPPTPPPLLPWTG